jgi:hypothetical protein
MHQSKMNTMDLILPFEFNQLALYGLDKQLGN